MMKNRKLVKGIALAAVITALAARRNSCISHGF